MLDDWPRRFPGCEPIAHQLKLTLADRWVRFHSLPGSKRYPEDESEYAELLGRHNRVLGRLTGADPDVVLLTTGSSWTPEPVRPEPDVFGPAPGDLPWRTVPMHEQGGPFDPETPVYWHVYAKRWTWRPGVFDPLVRLAADWVVVNVMVAAPDCRWLLHPYDGGMDVIAESSAYRDLLKTEFRDWLSARPDGLRSACENRSGARGPSPALRSASRRLRRRHLSNSASGRPWLNFRFTKLWHSTSSPPGSPPGAGWSYVSNRTGSFVSGSTYTTAR
jgi:hypothetical protein